jgi:thiol-disulfide isomerase/thioredoxin
LPRVWTPGCSASCPEQHFPKIEQKLIDTLKPQGMNPAVVGIRCARARSHAACGREARYPRAPTTTAHDSTFAPLAGATGWINSPALTAADLRGKVVLVDFWTYSCINCLRTLPFIKAWADKYKDAGLVVVGVHSPEFAFEKNPDNVRKAVKDLGITYPVAVDSDHAIWRGFHNRAWPALYFIDAQGKVRDQVLGEGRYEESERLIQKLLAENGKAAGAGGFVNAQGEGTQAAPGGDVQSGETYVGYERATGFVGAGGMQADRLHRYESAASLRLNQWTLGGEWVGRSRACRRGARRCAPGLALPRP